jgi:beta-mannosidase
MPKSIKFDVGAINTTQIISTNVASDLKIPDTSDAVLIIELTAQGQLPNAASGKTTTFTHHNHFLPVWPNQAKVSDPKLQLSYNKSTKSFTVESTTGVSLYTWLTHPAGTLGFFDDNAFVLAPGQKKEVGFTLQEDTTGGKWTEQVTVESLWDLTTK